MVVPIVSQHPVFRHQLGDGNRKARRRDGGDEVKNLVGVGKIRVARSPQQIADWDFKQHTDHLDGHRPNHQDHGSLHKALLLTGPLQLSTHFPQNAPTHSHNLPYSVAGFQFLFCKSFLKRRCSFPFEYIGKPVNLRVKSDILEIYYKTELVAKHELSTKNLIIIKSTIHSCCRITLRTMTLLHKWQKLIWHKWMTSCERR